MHALLALLLALPAAPEPQDTPTAPELLQAPDVEAGDFDWIRLTSGEWLKGEILRLRDGTLEFDSDELGELNLDWDDIAYLRTGKTQTLLLTDQSTLEGTLVLSGGRVYIGGAQALELPGGELCAILPGAGGDTGVWSGNASLGFVMRRGNTSTTDLSTNLFARRETVRTRWDSSYKGAFSRTQGVETANNHRLQSQYDYFLSPRLYVTPITAVAYRDPFSNIDLRLTPAAGFGYDLLDENTLSWEVGGGPAFQYTRFESVAAGQDQTDASLAVFANTRIAWDVTPDVEMSFGYEITAPVPDTDEYNHHLSSAISVDLVGSLDLDVNFVWDRINKPPVDQDGNTPRSDDIRLSVGLGWDF